LFDGYCRGDAGDLINFRLFDPLQKLTRISRQRLDIAPLAFGIDRVESETGLA
jgi:hypothetical protein